MMNEREKCTPLRSYISRAVNVGLWERELLRGPPTDNTENNM